MSPAVAHKEQQYLHCKASHIVSLYTHQPTVVVPTSHYPLYDPNMRGNYISINYISTIFIS